jgi:DNA-directed RNA polymerase specialized sigma subunit
MQAPITVTVESVLQFNDENTLAQRAAAEALARRNEAVLAVLESGQVNQSELAERLGISPGRVSQIAATARSRRIVDAAIEDIEAA